MLHPSPIVTVTLGIANWQWHGSGRQGGAAAWIAASFGQGRPISQSAKVQERWPRLAGMGSQARQWVELVFIQQATAHTAQPDPKKRKEVMASCCLFPTLPIARPKRAALLLKRTVAATRASAY